MGAIQCFEGITAAAVLIVVVVPGCIHGGGGGYFVWFGSAYSIACRQEGERWPGDGEADLAVEHAGKITYSKLRKVAKCRKPRRSCTARYWTDDESVCPSRPHQQQRHVRVLKSRCKMSNGAKVDIIMIDDAKD